MPVTNLRNPFDPVTVVGPIPVTPTVTPGGSGTVTPAPATPAQPVDAFAPATPAATGTTAPVLQPVTAPAASTTAPAADLYATGTTSSAVTARLLKDPALNKGLGTATLPIVRGARGTPTVALQYTLGKLGLLNGMADGIFGSGTERSVKAFQQLKGLPQTGALDEATLAKLDATMATFDGRVEAAKRTSPHAYLRDFNARGLSRLNVTSRPITWQNTEVQAAYGKFVGEYWGVLKANKVEADCKSLAQEFMDAFRAKVKADLGAELPLPSNGTNRMLPFKWAASTATDRRERFSRTDALTQVRPGYEIVQAIEKLDPKASLIPGVQLFNSTDGGANEVARSATPTTTWRNAIDNRGDSRVAEVPLDKLKTGDLIFIDHTGDGRWDHTVNVTNVERRSDGTARITLAVGSFDDMKDANGSTLPRGGFEVNTYAEEVQVEVGSNGRIASSKVSWSSEPSYLVNPRYSATSTLMELEPGGRIMVGRWGG